MTVRTRYRKSRVGAGVKGNGLNTTGASTVTQHLMLPGHFQLTLSEDCPVNIRQALVPLKEPTTTAELKALWSHIVITPRRFDPDLLSDSLLSGALYTGVVTEAWYEDGMVELAGHDAATWLGDGYGIGNNLGLAGVARTAGTLSEWITDLLPGAITAGSVTNTGTTLTDWFRLMSRREAIDAVCRSVGAEWRVNPNFTLDAAAPTTLYSSTPSVLLAPDVFGVEGSLRAVGAVFPRIGYDASRYLNEVRVYGPGTGTDILDGSATVTSIVLNPLTGAAATRRMLVDAADLDRAELGKVATAILGDWSEPISAFTVQAKDGARALRQWVSTGHYVWVFWPGVVENTTNAVEFAGDVMPARKMRVYSFKWPIEPGQGVYFRRTDAGGVPEYIDLTDWVQWSDDLPQLTVGYRRRPPRDDYETFAGRLAQHQELNRRANDTAAQRQRIIYTPSGTVDATTLTTYTDWFTIGTVDVPSWAAGVDVDVTIGAVRDLTAANNQYDLRLVLGTGNGATEAFTGLGVAIRFAARMQHRFTVTPPAGSLTLKVQAKRPSGTGQFRLNTDSNVTAVCRFFTA